MRGVKVKSRQKSKYSSKVFVLCYFLLLLVSGAVQLHLGMKRTTWYLLSSLLFQFNLSGVLIACFMRPLIQTSKTCWQWLRLRPSPTSLVDETGSLRWL